ncbi:MAG: DUF624 domain-containing protein [Lachnospiraceae bacterium]|nr:DUF624 domain-containing protein [Lachnospiraceae bacterium]
MRGMVEFHIPFLYDRHRICFGGAIMPMDNPVIKFLNKMTDLIVLNLLFVICSLPVITIGASLTAMYAVSLRSVRYGDGYVVKTFFKHFKQNFVQATLAWMGVLGLIALFVIDYLFWSRMEMGILSDVMLMICYAMAFLVWIVVLWLFPVIAKMQDKLWRQIKNAAAMALGHFFPYTAICAGMTGVVAYLVYTNLGAVLIMLFVGCATLSYMLSFFFYKVFAQYIQEDSFGDDDLLYGQKEKFDED